MIKKAAEQRLKEAAECVECVDADKIDPDNLEGWLILDVREADEFAKGYIPGAINVPRSRLEMLAIQNEALQKVADCDTLVYCASGKRSLLAAETLKALGAARPVSMEGGFNAWHGSGKPVKKPD